MLWVQCLDWRSSGGIKQAQVTPGYPSRQVGVLAREPSECRHPGMFGYRDQAGVA